MAEIDAPRAAPVLSLWRVERILYDQDGLLVVDKPAGLVVHGGDEALEDDCVHRLSAFRASQGKGEQLYVHQRLDLATSGVMFFVTDPALNSQYSAAMEAHRISREYMVVVEVAAPAHSGGYGLGRGAGSGKGRTNKERRRAKGPKPDAGLLAPLQLPEAGSIEVWLLHERGRSRVVPEGTAQAKRAITHFKVLERQGVRALLKVTLSTGRPHQIRASLAHLGAPVVGDVLYGARPHGRLMLHARAISGGPLPSRFEADLPFEFETWSADPTPAQLSALSPKKLRRLIFDSAMKRAKVASATEAFRLVNGEPDGLPGCTVDAYGAYVCVNSYDEAYEPRVIRTMASALLELGFAGVYEKQRLRADLRRQDALTLAPDVPVLGERAPDRFSVDEHGMQVGIELHEGLSTGLFVDMRLARVKMRGFAQELPQARMLNLFCYTCSFSVAAALGGAVTTNVDLSGKALGRGRLNFELNGLEPAQHRFFKEDALKYLSKASRRGDRFELIVLDPPSFATVGKATFNVSGHYQDAARFCFELLAPGGRLLCVTNHLKTSPRQFVQMVEEAARDAGRSLGSLRSLKSSPDCPDHKTGPHPSKAVLATVI